MDTLLFNPESWGELLVNARGDIAVASEPYRTAQDVSTATKMFKADLWYNISEGIPYLEEVYAKDADIPVLRDFLEKQAFKINGVFAVEVLMSDFTDRKLSGRVIINNEFEVII